MVRNVYSTAVVMYAGKIPEDGVPKKSQLNRIARMCQGGEFKTAFKRGGRWLIDLEKEREFDGDDE